MILSWHLVVRLKDLRAILPVQQGLNTKLFHMYLQIGMKEHVMQSTCIGAALCCENQGFFWLQLLLTTPSWTDLLELVCSIWCNMY